MLFQLLDIRQSFLMKHYISEHLCVEYDLILLQ